jgi:hypothetical protein
LVSTHVYPGFPTFSLYNCLLSTYYHNGG